MSTRWRTRPGRHAHAAPEVIPPLEPAAWAAGVVYAPTERIDMGPELAAPAWMAPAGGSTVSTEAEASPRHAVDWEIRCHRLLLIILQDAPPEWGDDAEGYVAHLQREADRLGARLLPPRFYVEQDAATPTPIAYKLADEDEHFRSALFPGLRVPPAGSTTKGTGETATGEAAPAIVQASPVPGTTDSGSGAVPPAGEEQGSAEPAAPEPEQAEAAGEQDCAGDGEAS